MAPEQTKLLVSGYLIDPHFLSHTQTENIICLSQIEIKCMSHSKRLKWWQKCLFYLKMSSKKHTKKTNNSPLPTHVVFNP